MFAVRLERALARLEAALAVGRYARGPRRGEPWDARTGAQKEAR